MILFEIFFRTRLLGTSAPFTPKGEQAACLHGECIDWD